ncbi:DUF4064 domain-containing protein [Bacillus spongiae]|uniref:DUF4064 domain-containing protein n=1 Tax=Bacillus spongiae TaxID=2683610 RepID=A0ABU8HF07_9BACI
MKRTAEIILSVIGVIISALLSLFVGGFTALFSNDKVRREMEAELAANPDFAASDIVVVMDFIDLATNVGWFAVAGGVIGIVLGAVAIFSLKGNKNPKLAGILLIIAAVLVGVMAFFFFGWIPALFFLIAGIVSLVRKSRKTEEVI